MAGLFSISRVMVYTFYLNAFVLNKQEDGSIGVGGSAANTTKKNEQVEQEVPSGEQVNMSSRMNVTTSTSRQTYVSSSVESHGGAVIEFSSMHSVSSEFREGEGDGVMK